MANGAGVHKISCRPALPSASRPRTAHSRRKCSSVVLSTGTSATPSLCVVVFFFWTRYMASSSLPGLLCNTSEMPWPVPNTFVAAFSNISERVEAREDAITYLVRHRGGGIGGQVALSYAGAEACALFEIEFTKQTRGFVSEIEISPPNDAFKFGYRVPK